MPRRIRISQVVSDRIARLAESEGVTSEDIIMRGIADYAMNHYPGVAGRLHPCVNVVACPQCGADKGIPCLGAHGQRKQDTHYVRRNAYRKRRMQ